MMLDLAGYVTSKDLTVLRVVEPACGDGAFLVPLVERLIISATLRNRSLKDLSACIRAFDVDEDAVARARTTVGRMLRDAGGDERTVSSLVAAWIQPGDYLLPGPEEATTDLVIGNPPYVRLEQIPKATSSSYRARWDAMSGRADLYIGFLQAALTSLAPNGRVAYICPDRWMRNQYGRRLREVVAAGFNLDVCITLHDTDAFQERVAAYPAVVVLSRGEHHPTLTVDANGSFRPPQARSVVSIARRGPAPVPVSAAFTASWVERPRLDGGSWPTGSSNRLRSIEQLEQRFPALGSTESGTKVGVGLATGADKVYISSDTSLVEADRQLPLVFAEDLQGGQIASAGRFLVNPWDSTGGLVDLASYPALRDYLTENSRVLLERHVAKKNPKRWYRTIDKVDPELLPQPKILLPDLRSRVQPVLDNGRFYPQHNLFYVVADASWDLEVLGGLLLSDVATAMVEAYSVKMANGALRVTAQYLRRIRVPTPTQISAETADALRSAFRQRDINAATLAAYPLYGIDSIA